MSLHLPFAGITERPYDQALLADVDWSVIEPRSVRLSLLWLTQPKLTIEGLFGKSYSTDAYPRVVRVIAEDGDDREYLEDGHHRIVREVIAVQGLGCEAPKWHLCRIYELSEGGER